MAFFSRFSARMSELPRAVPRAPLKFNRRLLYSDLFAVELSPRGIPCRGVFGWIGKESGRCERRTASRRGHKHTAAPDFETVFGDVVGTTDREQLAIRNESTAAEQLTVASPVGASCFYYPHAGVS